VTAGFAAAGLAIAAVAALACAATAGTTQASATAQAMAPITRPRLVTIDRLRLIPIPTTLPAGPGKGAPGLHEGLLPERRPHSVSTVRSACLPARQVSDGENTHISTHCPATTKTEVPQHGSAVEHLPAEMRGDLEVPAHAYPVQRETASGPNAHRWMG